ncbi:hypothetical protein NEMIN01_0296 [Nematocida minor]|uniref:uncharacterized protein n=1 Tax=Nematocida minor TaxID=1912983 RepID=UPI00221E8073|nr:uncharacterized protein NEMIN01_0296 [Nematocida minor]KAI5189130.1 hypothetical protein NEMIN01_0296 [Nematocida minor]
MNREEIRRTNSDNSSDEEHSGAAQTKGEENTHRNSTDNSPTTFIEDESTQPAYNSHLSFNLDNNSAVKELLSQHAQPPTSRTSSEATERGSNASSVSSQTKPVAIVHSSFQTVGSSSNGHNNHVLTQEEKQAEEERWYEEEKLRRQRIRLEEEELLRILEDSINEDTEDAGNTTNEGAGNDGIHHLFALNGGEESIGQFDAIELNNQTGSDGIHNSSALNGGEEHSANHRDTPRNNGGRSDAESRRRNGPQRNKSTKPRRAFKPLQNMSDYLRNTVAYHLVAFKIIGFVISALLLVLISHLPFYYRITMCVLGLVAVGISHIKSERSTITNSATLSSLVLLVFFLVSYWPAAQLLSAIVYAFVVISWMVVSFHEKNYANILMCISGSFITVLFCMMGHWMSLVEPAVVWVFIMPSMFYVALLFNIGLIPKLSDIIRDSMHCVINDINDYFEIRQSKKLNSENIAKKEEEIRQIKASSPGNHEKLNKCKEELSYLREVNFSYAIAFEPIKERYTYNYIANSLNDLLSFDTSYRALKSIHRHAKYVLVLTSIIAGVGFVFIVCYLRSETSLGEYTLLFIQSIKNNPILGNAVHANFFVQL